MSDDNSSASHGPPVPPEALQQGSMNTNPFYEIDRDGTQEVPEVEKTQFGLSNDGRTSIVLPGKYPTPPRTVRTTGDKTVTLKKGTITRIDH